MTGRRGPAGIYPMLYALFDKNERIDAAAMRRQTDALIRRGVHGIAVLGLATEVNKMSLVERRAMLDFVAEAVGGRVPLSVTIGEPSVPGQIEFARAAKAAGAGWVILQTPPVRGASETALLRFFGGVAEKVDLPIGLQIAPAYLGLDMSASSLRALRRQHPNVALLKIESDPLTTARLIEETEGAFTVFNGRAGLEMTDNLDAGCAGIIPGAESADRLARIFTLHRSARAGDRARAAREYRSIAPLLTFLETSLDNLLVYGKRILAQRLGLPEGRAAPRRPFAPPHPFGTALAKRHARGLGRL